MCVVVVEPRPRSRARLEASPEPAESSLRRLWRATQKDRKAPAKVALTRLGSRCGPGLLYNLNGALNYLYVGWWMRAHGFTPAARLGSREELLRWLGARVGDEDVLYLEFGVAAGASIRLWSELLHNPRSALHGFDSFLGLPHDWTLEGHERGSFSTGGKVPELGDDRVRFFPGWFEETLPAYEWSDHEVLVVAMDADLYTSTSTALRHVKDRLVPGSYLYFDQFHHRGDELRAFAEFLDENRFEFALVAATEELTNVAFKRIA